MKIKATNVNIDSGKEHKIVAVIPAASLEDATAIAAALLDGFDPTKVSTEASPEKPSKKPAKAKPEPEEDDEEEEEEEDDEKPAKKAAPKKGNAKPAEDDEDEDDEDEDDEDEDDEDDEDEDEDDSDIPAELLKATKLREVFEFFINKKKINSIKAIVKECEAIKSKVPVLAKADIKGRAEDMCRVLKADIKA